MATTVEPSAFSLVDFDAGRIAAITDAGFEITVEPSATTPAGELSVLMNGGMTFALLDHGEMVWRSKHRIKYRDANNERVHAKHECDKRAPENNPLFVKGNTRTTDYDVPPPY